MLCTVKWVKKKSPTVESSTWQLNSHDCSENNAKKNRPSYIRQTRYNHLNRFSQNGQNRAVIEHLSSQNNTIIIVIIKLESAVQGRERVRTLYESEDPNPTQPTN